jgi:hypothetical protein
VFTLLNNLLRLIQSTKGGARTTDIDTLLDLIEGYLPDNFCMVVDDNSTEEVGDEIWEVYCTCGDGDISHARGIFNQLEKVGIRFYSRYFIQKESLVNS